jgi:hypothetical protein
MAAKEGPSVGGLSAFRLHSTGGSAPTGRTAANVRYPIDLDMRDRKKRSTENL